MLTRRRFTTLSAAAAGALLTAPLESKAAATRSGLEFGVQLYTVRNDMSDLGAMLGLIHSIGYASVETFSGVYTRPAKELKSLIASSGLKAPSGHFDYETLEEKVDYAAELGVEYMICPMIPESRRDSLEGFHKAAKHLNRIAARAQAAGLKFGYHAHNYEFKKLGDERGFDVLMREFDPAVRIELDVYWATEAGQNPVELMRQNRKRLELVHIKDRKLGAFTVDLDLHSPRFAEAGSGTIDWKAVLGEAKRLGVKQYFVDQDWTNLPIEQCLRVNWNYLSQLNV